MSPSNLSPGYQRAAGSRIANGSVGKCGSRGTVSDLHPYDLCRVVAEDIDDLDGHGLASWRGVGMRGADQFQGAVPARAERLPLVLEDVAPGPLRYVVHRSIGPFDRLVDRLG